MTLISFEQFGYSKPDARENKRSENQKKKKDIEVLKHQTEDLEVLQNIKWTTLASYSIRVEDT